MREPLDRATDYVGGDASDQHRILEPDGSPKPFPFQETIEQGTERIDRHATDQSFKDFLAHHSFPPAVRRAALDYVEGFHAAHPERLSVNAFAAAEDAATAAAASKLYPPAPARG